MGNTDTSVSPVAVFPIAAWRPSLSSCYFRFDSSRAQTRSKVDSCNRADFHRGYRRFRKCGSFCTYAYNNKQILADISSL